ncbi:MMPL family transporter [Tessaracoccus sp. SD287]|uniref:MMPL family transporter n=1 Tax=Tessaracoccus sp. SD287 TaxID=2782008 RepID=UPI001A969052|nr:efflux RND transporter permease subunit [Tessaracoccus sp. SD287]MBO1030503.1 MMPL family transporter [Tessaracoccus sp. SD287]
MSTTPTRRRWLRVLLPAVLILMWLAGAAIGGPYFGRVGEVSSNEQANYLPSSADATKVQALLGEFNDSDAIPAIVVFTSETPLSEADLGAISAQVADLAQLQGVAEGVSPAIPSEDGLAVQAFVPISSDLELAEVVAELSQVLRDGAPDGVEVHVTGPAGFAADIGDAFAGIDGLLLGVALLAVFVILVVVYRSLLLPIVVLATSLFALCVALLSVWWLAKADVLLLSGQTQGILFILVIGAATDYSLLYVARFREELRSTRDTWQATQAALRGSFEPILASGSTVIAGLLCLLLSDLKSNSTLGPVASIGIVFAMLSALTLLPALLLLLGRAAFWPRRPRFEPDVVAAEHGVHTGGLWSWLGLKIKKRARTIWIITAAVLALGVVGATQLNAVGVPQSDLVLGESQARDGQVLLGEHFPGGSGSPAIVVVPQDRMQDAANILLKNSGVQGVSIVAADSPSGTAPVTADGIQPLGQPGTPAPAPTVVDGQVMLQATLDAAADSDQAAETVRTLRTELDAAVPGALVGGVTATAVDTNDSSIHDRNLIIPVILAVILVILALLLRSILAPVLLVATTVLSFGAALGVAALVFNNLLDFPGADPAVPLYSFVFLVALGIDYNIFLMTRVREESLRHGTRQGILRGLSITGGVITSAGLVLAATFAALSVIPILFLVQIAFIVAFGVLLDTFIVRSLLVPALSYDIGRAIWWPSKLSRQDPPQRAAEEPAGEDAEEPVAELTH